MQGLQAAYKNDLVFRNGVVCGGIGIPVENANCCGNNGFFHSGSISNDWQDKAADV